MRIADPIGGASEAHCPEPSTLRVTSGRRWPDEGGSAPTSRAAPCGRLAVRSVALHVGDDQHLAVREVTSPSATRSRRLAGQPHPDRIVLARERDLAVAPDDPGRHGPARSGPGQAK